MRVWLMALLLGATIVLNGGASMAQSEAGAETSAVEATEGEDADGGVGALPSAVPDAGPTMTGEQFVVRLRDLEQRINELMRRFDEHQGAMNNGGGPRMQPMPQGPQRRMRASRPDGVQREARVEGMQKGLQQNIDRRVIEVRSLESDGDPRAMLEELREQLQQMKSQMMKMRKDQAGAKAEQG